MSTSIERSTASRRTFLQRVALSGLAAGPGSALLAACAGGGSDDDPDTAGSTDAGATDDPAAEADNPFGLDPEGEVEIFIFDGGFGDAYATEIHEPLLQAKWPNLTINHNKDADITGALQSRFVAGPDRRFAQIARYEAYRVGWPAATRVSRSSRYCLRSSPPP